MLFCPSHLIRKVVHFIAMALHSFQLSIESFFKKLICTRQRSLVRPEFILLGDGAVALKDTLAPSLWHVRVISAQRNTITLVC